MANTMSKVREQQRQLKAEAKRLARAQRRRARRVGALPGGGSGHSTGAAASERVVAACVGRQSASEAGAVG